MSLVVIFGRLLNRKPIEPALTTIFFWSALFLIAVIRKLQRRAAQAGATANEGGWSWMCWPIVMGWCAIILKSRCYVSWYIYVVMKRFLKPCMWGFTKVGATNRSYYCWTPPSFPSSKLRKNGYDNVCRLVVQWFLRSLNIIFRSWASVFDKINVFDRFHLPSRIRVTYVKMLVLCENDTPQKHYL